MKLSSLLRDRRGVSSVEYVLLLIGILVVGALGYRALGSNNATAANTTTAVFSGGQATVAGSGGGPYNGGGGPSGNTDGICKGRGCAAPGSCFVAGTLVATPSGERPIESLTAGELVFARNERGGDEVTARPIVRTFVRPAASLVDVHIVTLDGARESVRSTPEHPYFTLGRGWLGAGELAAGETLVDRAGREVQVTKVVAVAQEAIVYNLEVDADHTYFVGHSALWVHNQPCAPPPSPPSRALPTGVVSPGSEEPLSPEEQAFKNTVGNKRYDNYMSKAKAAKDSNESLANVPTVEVAAIYGYTTGGPKPDYSKLNGALRNEDQAQLAALKPYIDNATQGLGKLPDHQGTVYSRVNLDPATLAKYQPGETVTHAAFTSSSKENKSNFGKFKGDVQFIIKSNHGKDISHISQFRDEKEVVFPPGTNFKVGNRYPDPKDPKVTIVELTEL